MRSATRYFYTAHSTLSPKPGCEAAASHFMAVVDKALRRPGRDLGRMVGLPSIDQVVALQRDSGHYRFEFIASAPLAWRELRLLELHFTAMNHDAPCEAAFRWDLDASDPTLREVLQGQVARRAAAKVLH